MLSVVAPGFDGFLADLGEEIQFGAGGIFGRELDVVAIATRLASRFRPPASMISSVVIFSLNSRWMALVARKTWMRFLGASFERFGGSIDVGGVAASQAGNHGAPNLAGNGLHRLKVAGRSDREAGFDDVHAQVAQSPGHFQLLGKVHASSRATARRRARWCRR